MVEGRLSCSELEDRLAAVYAAKTFGELDPLTADLPFPGSATPLLGADAAAGSWPRDGRLGVQQRPTNTLAVMSFVFAFAFFPLGPIFGLIACKQIKRSGEEGLTLALAGHLVSLMQFLSVVAAVALIVGMPGPSLPPL